MIDERRKALEEATAWETIAASGEIEEDDVVIPASVLRRICRQALTEPAVPDAVLPHISEEMWEHFKDTSLMEWKDGPHWTQDAVDFASAIKMDGWFSLEELEERDRALAQQGSDTGEFPNVPRGE